MAALVLMIVESFVNQSGHASSFREEHRGARACLSLFHGAFLLFALMRVQSDLQCF